MQQINEGKPYHNAQAGEKVEVRLPDYLALLLGGPGQVGIPPMAAFVRLVWRKPIVEPLSTHLRQRDIWAVRDVGDVCDGGLVHVDVVNDVARLALVATRTRL